MAYPGGKAGAGVYQRIINNMPPHRVYIECFLGGGAVMLAKRPATYSIGIDADAVVIETWQRYLASTSNLTLVHDDAIEWLVRNDISDDTLVYLDPPYLMSTRRQQRQIYRCELSDHDHERLLEIIKSLNCMVMLSGYWSEMYSDALQGWRTDTFTTRTRGGSLAEEWLWMNFPEPLELHDYRYLGGDFRDRERIKRKVTRWKNRLINMNALEKHAIMAAIAELKNPAATIAENGVVITTPQMALPTSAQLELAMGAPIGINGVAFEGIV
jgi:hypothetical protein